MEELHFSADLRLRPSSVAAKAIARWKMRSGLIFAVSERINNRYMLCRMLAASARKMHRDGVSISQSINRSLQVLHQAPTAGDTARVASTAEAAETMPEKESAVLVP